MLVEDVIGKLLTSGAVVSKKGMDSLLPDAVRVAFTLTIPSTRSPNVYLCIIIMLASHVRVGLPCRTKHTH